MSESHESRPSTLGLNTLVETDFVSPLTAVRGSLEILRDFDDLTAEERRKFVNTALQACLQLEAGVDNLSASVYAAGEAEISCRPAHVTGTDFDTYSGRISVNTEAGAIEIDFSDFVFSSSKIVNDFFDSIEAIVENTGQSWFFVVNSRDCRVWPEAWVAYAHRGKKINSVYSDGTVRYATHRPGDGAEPNRRPDSLAPYYAESRDAAMDMIAAMRTRGR